MLFSFMEQIECIMAKPAKTDTKDTAKKSTPRTKPVPLATTAAVPSAPNTEPSRRRKAATAPAAADAIAAAPGIDPVLVTESRGPSNAAEMKKRELVDRVVKHGNLKKNEVKPVVDAVLAVLGEVLAEGRELNLPPMGKLKVKGLKTTAGGQVIRIKLRTGTAAGAENAAKTGDEALAEPAE